MRDEHRRMMVDSPPINLEQQDEFVNSDSKQSLVYNLRDVDILLGRGKRNNNREANMRLRQMAEDRADDYMQAEGKQEKAIVAELMIQDIQSNGARFLKPVSVPDNGNGTYRRAYEVVNPSVVAIKIKQLLRDRSAIQTRERVGLPRSKRQSDALRNAERAAKEAKRTKMIHKASFDTQETDSTNGFNFEDIAVGPRHKTVSSPQKPSPSRPVQTLPPLPDELFPYPPPMTKLCITHRILEQVAYRRRVEELRTKYDMEEFDYFQNWLQSHSGNRSDATTQALRRAHYQADDTDSDPDATESESEDDDGNEPHPSIQRFYQDLPERPPKCLRQKPPSKQSPVDELK